jgi:heme A synthase
MLIVQVGLGDVVVNSGLNAAITAVHLANATALFAVMVIAGTYMHIREKRSPP